MKIYYRKTYLLLGILLFFVASCFVVQKYRHHRQQSKQQVPVGFRADVMLGMTPIKDQGKSELCWVYAMLATIETNHLVQGDSVNLSADYIGRMYLEEQAIERFRSKGAKQMSMRGMGPMTIDLLMKYGAMPFDSYHPRKAVNYKAVLKKVEKAVDEALSSAQDEARCLRDVQELLDKEIGALPRAVFMLGAKYTFLEFAHSVCMSDEYHSVTSLADYPYGETIRLPFADNQYDCEAMNANPDDLISLMEKALENKQAVLWEGGPNDNHAVSIIGMGKDKDGKEYFVAKNSWGKDNPTKGLLYIEKDYVRKHTAVIIAPTPRESEE